MSVYNVHLFMYYNVLDMHAVFLVSFSYFNIFKCLNIFTPSLPPDLSVPFLLQHIWHPALVPHSVHTLTHSFGQSSGRPHSQVPLVCRRLSYLVLFHSASAGSGTLHRRLAGPGGRRGTDSGDVHYGGDN